MRHLIRPAYCVGSLWTAAPGTKIACPRLLVEKALQHAGRQVSELDFSDCRDDVFHTIISIVLIAGRFGNGLYISVKPIQKPMLHRCFLNILLEKKTAFAIKKQPTLPRVRMPLSAFLSNHTLAVLHFWPVVFAHLPIESYIITLN